MKLSRNNICLLLLSVGAILSSCTTTETTLYGLDGTFSVFIGHVASVEMDSYFGDDRGSITHYFSAGGRLEKSIGTYPRIDTPLVDRYSYNDVDSTMSLCCTYPDGYVQIYTYRCVRDGKGRLCSCHDETGGVYYRYDRSGHITEVVAEDEDGQQLSRENYTYSHGQLVTYRLEATFLNGLISESRYEYDKSGNLVRMESTLPDETRITTYSDYVVDDHGNWTSRRATDSHGSITEHRSFTYY